jgi:predicted nuclease of predicted toxin-antitoxin system
VRVWIDAQVSPALARWLREELGVDAVAVRELGMRTAEDPEIFAGARHEGAVVLTKDSDFVDLVARIGPPPQIIWLTCGNTSNAYLRGILRNAWPHINALLAAGEPLVEVGGRST